MAAEALVGILVVLIVLAIPVMALILAIVAIRRSDRVDQLARRLGEVEARLGRLGRLEETQRVATGPQPVTPTTEPAAVPVELVAEPRPSLVAMVAGRELQRAAREPIQWELFIGRKALGWVAVVLLTFAVAFFLRYAFQNQWIGPLGRVSLGAVFGLGLMAAGWHYERHGWRVFAQMLLAAGVVVLYLASYSAFGFYHLLPQQAASAFLALIVIESAILAVEYDSWAVALMAVAGGLLTPALMRSERDQYMALFTYLAVLDAGVLLLLVYRTWAAIGTVAFLGTQALFWSWYGLNYHPEKFAWALGFQAVIYGLFLAHSVVTPLVRPRRIGGEHLARLVLEAVFWFGAVYVLLREDYGDWLGTAAMGMAMLYAVLARVMLAWRPAENRQLLAALAIAVGFVALAFPLQAEATWIALGWAAEAAALWWFGLRVSAPVLRGIAAGLAMLAVLRLVRDFPGHWREPFVPVFNAFALPALGVIACLLGAVAATRRFAPRLATAERMAVGAVGLGALVLLWLVLSVDASGFFDAQARLDQANRLRWEWLGEMSLSILWAVYATVLLAIGFRFRQAGMRWLAMGLYAVTVGKVFLVDMAELEQIYRILAFFVLAILMGVAARAYQRIRLEPPPAGEAEGAEHGNR